MSQRESVKKTFLISEDQDRRLKAYCNYHHISGSQVLRLFIDELQVTQYDNLRSSIETESFKVQNFLGTYDNEKPITRTLNDGNGNKQTRWYKKSSRWLKPLNLF